MKTNKFANALNDTKKNAEFRNRVTEVLFETGYPDYALALRAFRQVVPVSGNLMGCTDYNNLFLNENLSDDELSIVARHEILHVMLRHNKRAPKDFRRRMWNMACDYELSHYYSVYDNRVLAQSAMLHDGCYIARHVKYGNKTARQIYDMLVFDLNKQREAKEKLEQEMQNSGLNMPSLPDSDMSGDEDFDPNDISSSTANDTEESETAETDDDFEPDLTDEADEDDAEQRNGEGEGEGENDEDEDAGDNEDDEECAGDNEDDNEDWGDSEDGEDEFDDFDPDKLNDEMRDNAEKEAEDSFDEMDLGEDESDIEHEEQLRKAMELALKAGYDSLTDEQKEQMENSELVDNSSVGKDGIGTKTEPPKLDAAIKLKYQLKSYFIKQEQVDKGRTYRRPNKKYAKSPFIVKGKSNVYKPSKTIACYVDVSGSMSMDMVKRALEVVEGLKKIKRMEVKIHYFNTRIHDEFRSGGGTDYREVLNHATRNKYPCIAVITDASNENWYDYKWEFEAVWLIGVQPSYGRPYPFERVVETPTHPATTQAVIKCKKFQYNEVLPVCDN